VTQTENSRDKFFASLLMFVIGFVGFSLVGAILLILLLALGLLPVI
jgi:hypothetical protein